MPVTSVLPHGLQAHQHVSIKEFAALRNVSPDTVRRLIKGGKIQARKVSERRVAIPASELLK
jgi:excisionase family DNA binding protein